MTGRTTKRVVAAGVLLLVAATARIERVVTDIDDSTLKSPILGRVQVKVAEPGEVLSAGGRVLASAASPRSSRRRGWRPSRIGQPASCPAA